MNNKLDINTIDEIKDKIINVLLLLYAVISIPLLLLSISRLTVTGWLPVYYLQIIVFVIFISFFFIRKKLSYRQKALFSAILLLLLCLSGMQCLGIFSGMLMFMLLFTVLVALFIGKKFGYISLFIVFFSIATYSMLYGFNILTYDFDVYQMIIKRNLWFTEGLVLIVVGYSIILIVTRFESAYSSILEQSAQRESDYRLLFEQAAEGIVILDSEGNILMVNEYFKRMSGYTTDDVKGKNVTEFMVSESRDEIEIWYRKLSTQKTIHSLQVVVNKKKEVRSVEVRASMLPDGRIQALLTDITRQQEMIREVEEQKAFRKSLIEALPGVFYVFESYDKMVQWNDGLLELSGYEIDELRTIHPNELFVNTQYDNENGLLGQTQKNESAFFRADLMTRNGSRVPLYHSAISYEQNGKIYLMGLAYDISGLVKTEEELKNSRENFKNIYNNTSDAIFIFNHKFEVLSANETFFELTGLKKDDLKQINVFDFIFGYNALQKVASEVNQTDKDRVVVAEYSVKNNKGESFPVEVRSRRITYQGQPAVVTAFNNISERKNLEKKVYSVSLKAEEDERGRIAKDLHDGLGPLLSTCKIYLHNLKNAYLEEREARAFAKLSELIDESLVGIKEISNNLSPHVLRNFGLVHALNVFIEKFTTGSEISIRSRFDAPGKYGEIIEITLYRVATELINNTIKHSGAKRVLIELNEKEGILIMKYSDNGKGFDPKVVSQKKQGLGLFNIKSRINSIGGTLLFNTEPGKGVEVIIETKI